MVGSLFTRINSNWIHANPFVSGPPPVIYSVGLAIVIASFAPIRRLWVAMVAMAFAVAMLVMWWLYATNSCWWWCRTVVRLP